MITFLFVFELFFNIVFNTVFLNKYMYIPRVNKIKQFLKEKLKKLKNAT